MTGSTINLNQKTRGNMKKQLMVIIVVAMLMTGCSGPKAAEASRKGIEADRVFTKLFNDRYGTRLEMPDEIVEAIRYGNSRSEEITIAWMDQAVKESKDYVPR